MSLIKNKYSSFFVGLYRFYFLKRFIKFILYRLEGAEFYSFSLREIQSKYYGVVVGKYSYGECMKLNSFPEGVTVGSYSSIARGVVVITHDHPINRMSTHPFFYNKSLGYTKKEKVEHTKLEIGSDVWIGDGAKILSKCNFIGHGAIVAAGAIVTRDVMPYEIVAGVPAKSKGFRFHQERINELLEEKWWDKDIADLIDSKKLFLDLN